MHYIQSKIMQKLLYTDSSNYAGLRPDRVESNHFAYHLEQLLKEGLIVKEGKTYRLSASGLAYVDSLSHGKMMIRRQPNICTMLDITTPDEQTLLFKRSFQPYIHTVGLPLGKIHYDEPIAGAAVRELAEKSGLSDVPLTQRGIAYIHVRQDGTTITRILCHVFHGEAPTALPVSIEPHRGEIFWANHHALDPVTLAPGFTRVKEVLANTVHFFFDEIEVSL